VTLTRREEKLFDVDKFLHLTKPDPPMKSPSMKKDIDY